MCQKQNKKNTMNQNMSTEERRELIDEYLDTVEKGNLDQVIQCINSGMYHDASDSSFERTGVAYRHI